MTKKNQPLTLIKRRPEVAAVISKLISPRVRPISNDFKKNIEYSVDETQASEISQSISQRIIDANNIFQLFPDIELAAQILISSILSPKDMMGTNLNISFNKKEIPAELSSKLTSFIKDELDNGYKIKNMLPAILRNMLFISGAYVEAIIPESSLDELINTGYTVSTEDIDSISEWMENTKSIGLLGPRSGSKGLIKSLEAIKSGIAGAGNNKVSGLVNGVMTPLNINDTTIDVIDDYRVLKGPMFLQKVRKTSIESILTSTKTSRADSRLTHRDMSTLLYKGIATRQNPFKTIPTSEQTVRKNIGKPLLLKLPTESVIPIYPPGDESNHIGYFILIDQDGHPVTKNILFQKNSGLVTPLGDQSASMSSLLITRAKTNLREMTNSEVSLDNITDMFANIVEADLIDRLKTGVYGSNVTVGRNLDVYRIMLARSLANQYTKLLYIPREICTYFAFNYYDSGIGKSLLDDLRVMLSLRAIILFSRVMALTKNSIATTHVNMTLDENDPDPQKTIEMGMHEIVRIRQQYFPLGINSPIDLVDWVQRAGLEFTFEGHPGLPNTKFDFEQKNSQFTVPDDSLDETLRKQTYMALGLSPETMDNGFNSEFATTVVSNNILLSKRILIYGQKFSDILTEHVKKIIKNDPNLDSKILELIEGNIEAISMYLTEEDKTFLQEDRVAAIRKIKDDFIEHMQLSLPKPDVTTIETQSLAFNNYSESLDKTIEAWINSDFVNNTVAGPLGENVDLIKATVKSYFLRKWMAENGYMPELSDITALDENGDSTLDIFSISKTHLNSVIKNGVNYIVSMQDMAKASGKDLSQIESAGASTDLTSSDTDTGMGDTDGDTFMPEENATIDDEAIDTDSLGAEEEEKAEAAKDIAEAEKAKEDTIIEENTPEDK